MYCPDCGHNNPEGNRFCGMCGEPLPQRRQSPAGTNAVNAEKREEQRERIAQHDPEPVPASFRHREPIDEPVRELPGTGLSPARPSSSPTQIEEPVATVSGPSFLGLSSGSNGSQGYSYLYEDEPPKSHAGFFMFLLLVAVLGGVLYWQRQPIQNWVVNRANQKVDTGTPASTAGSSTASSDNTSTPPAQTQPANPASGNSAAPAAQSPDQTPAQQQNASPDNSASPKNAQPDSKPKSDDKTAPDDQDQTDSTATAKPESKAAHQKTAAEARTSAARKHTEPQPPAGTELVASGEKYLYGRGAPQNCRQAVNDFNAAAQQENARAMAHLGALYATGECVPLNRVQAYQWFSRALSKDRSNTYLEHNLSMLWREMDANEKAQVSTKSPTEQSRMF